MISGRNEAGAQVDEDCGASRTAGCICGLVVTECHQGMCAFCFRGTGHQERGVSYAVVEREFVGYKLTS